MIEIYPADNKRIGDLDTLFALDESADRCWCMWFIVGYKDFHALGRDGNRAMFVSYTLDDPDPMGIIAYRNNAPVGWCAIGPRSRYTRAIRTPTMKHAIGDDEATWFVPCFFVHPDHRNAGIAAALLTAAVDVATAAGAVAVQGFPLAGTARRTSGADLMTGNEALFAAAGFEVESRPTGNRTIMRRNLK